jgi:hypothetical protein
MIATTVAVIVASQMGSNLMKEKKGRMDQADVRGRASRRRGQIVRESLSLRRNLGKGTHGTPE